MRIAHLADLHLGYRAYHRLAPGGGNQRERDVADAARAAFDRVASLEPDLVLVAGDVFHSVRPSNGAIMQGFRLFSGLRTALPDAPILVIAGNHDSPRSAETGSILRLFAEVPGVRVVDAAAELVELPELDAAVLCVPHLALRRGEVELEAPAGVSTNVLMLHGTVTGGGVDPRLRTMAEYGGARVPYEALRPADWSYIALGHYHDALAVAPNMWYAGATERTSTNIWAEAGVRKGFVTFETTTGEASFHGVPTRPVVDLPPLSARLPDGGRGSGGWRAPEELDAAVRERVAGIEGGIGGKIVRLVLEQIPADLVRRLDHAAIRRYKAEALHFHLDARRPDRRRDPEDALRPRWTLEQEVSHFLRERWSPGAGIDRSRLEALAQRYLAEVAGAAAGATPEPAPMQAGAPDSDGTAAVSEAGPSGNGGPEEPDR